MCDLMSLTIFEIMRIPFESKFRDEIVCCLLSNGFPIDMKITSTRDTKSLAHYVVSENLTLVIRFFQMKGLYIHEMIPDYRIPLEEFKRRIDFWKSETIEGKTLYELYHSDAQEKYDSLEEEIVTNEFLRSQGYI